MRRRFSAQQWADWIDEQRTSGMTVSEFCSHRHLSDGVFYRWRKKLAGDSAAAPRTASAVDHFVPLSVLPTASVEIDLPGGAVLRVSGDDGALRRVLRIWLELTTGQA